MQEHTESVEVITMGGFDATSHASTFSAATRFRGGETISHLCGTLFTMCNKDYSLSGETDSPTFAE